jgi:sulfite exporter TauE/SafE
MLGKKFHRHDQKNIFLFGLIIGLLPCAPLIAILSYIGLISKNWLQSLAYSLTFGIGTFVSPLILLVFLTGLLPKTIVEKNKIYNRIFNLICGLIIVFLGVNLVRRAF